jgi:hypothetical protein
MIAISDAPQLGHKLRSWIASGGSVANAALIANVLNSASTTTDVMVNLDPGFTITSKGNRIYSILDKQTRVEVLSFSLTEGGKGTSVQIL